MRWDEAEVGDVLMSDLKVDKTVYLAVEVCEAYTKWLNMENGVTIKTRRGSDRIMDYTLVKREA